MDFLTTLLAVVPLVIYAIPGFVLVKSKAVGGEHISAFAKFLMFACQPCLILYSFGKVEYDSEFFGLMCAVFGIALLLMGAFVAVGFFVQGKRRMRPDRRVYALATGMGNVSYIGIPLLEALLPEHPEALVFSTMFSIALNVLGWTVGCGVVSGDKKFISVKKILINPPVLTLIVALPLFFCGVKLPTFLYSCVTTLGKATTPMCMTVLGMRLATSSVKNIVSDYGAMIASAIKLIVFPLVAFAIVRMIPFQDYVVKAIYILCCAPVASIVQNLSELYGDAPSSAADCVLISTFASVLTIPIMLLLL